MEFNTVVLLANGSSPRKRDLSFLLRHYNAPLVCADGGANAALKMNMLPRLIIGDLDSLSPQAKQRLMGKTQFKQIRRQTDTDAEKAVKFLLAKGAQHIVLTGVIGSRLDHSISNLQLLDKYAAHCRFSVLAGESYMELIIGKVQIAVLPGEILSFYGMSAKTIVSCTGLKYPLNKFSLGPGAGESTSNVANAPTLSLTVHRGVCSLIREFSAYRQLNA